MLIALIRHGEAASFNGECGDAERPLTAAGSRAVLAAASQLLQKSPSFCTAKIYHSPFLRTTQTASFIAEVLHLAVENLPARALADSALSGRGVHSETIVEPADSLLGDNSADRVCRWLQSVEAQSVILVTHQPLVSNLCAWLVDGDRGSGYDAFPFYPASTAVLQANYIERGCAELQCLFHQQCLHHQ